MCLEFKYEKNLVSATSMHFERAFGTCHPVLLAIRSDYHKTNFKLFTACKITSISLSAIILLLLLFDKLNYAEKCKGTKLNFLSRWLKKEKESEFMRRYGKWMKGLKLAKTGSKFVIPLINLVNGLIELIKHTVLDLETQSVVTGVVAANVLGQLYLNGGVDPSSSRKRFLTRDPD